jgi:ribonucleoside-diphosphate reductase alpha chain
MMLKAITVYRDGSKLSQPLNSSMLSDLDEVVTLGDEISLDETIGPKEIHELQTHKLVRKKLPKRRGGITREATVGGQKIFLRTGEYEDGTLGEIFLDMYKDGAAFRGMLNSFAILASKALQYGVPLEELVDTFTFTKFEPQGIVQGHEAVKFASSVLDYVFRSLGYDYLNRTDFVHKKDNDKTTNGSKNPANNFSDSQTQKTSSINLDNTISAIDKLLVDVGITEDESVENTIPLPFTNGNGSSNLHFKKSPSPVLTQVKALLGYTGEQCTNCSSMRVKRNGSCLLCDDCGTTSGCS